MNYELIKVCGMRDADNIREVEALFSQRSIVNGQRSMVNGQWPTFLMGFIFWPKSKRYVSEKPAYLPTKCKRVGVFVDASIADIMQRVRDYSLDFVQLHGHETPDFIRQLTCHLSLVTYHLSLIKAFNIATAEDLEATKPYEGIVDYFLFDTKATLPGGSGQQFDWSILDGYHGVTPFLLSGGIGPEDTERVKTYYHPKCAGIDLNSRFELAPALKDVSALSRFLHEISEK